MTGRGKSGFLGFFRNQKGFAAVEFALIVPVLLLLYLGATDLTQGLAIDRKLGTLASSVSDLTAREREISLTKVRGYFDAAGPIMRPFDADRTGLRLTIVEVDGTGTRVVCADSRNWSNAGGLGESFELPSTLMPLADERYVVLVSARYQYDPMFGIAFLPTMNLEKRSFHLVRQDVDVDTYGC